MGLEQLGIEGLELPPLEPTPRPQTPPGPTPVDDLPDLEPIPEPTILPPPTQPDTSKSKEKIIYDTLSEEVKQRLSKFCKGKSKKDGGMNVDEVKKMFKTDKKDIKEGLDQIAVWSFW